MVNIMLPQYIDIARWQDLETRQKLSLVWHSPEKVMYCAKVATQWKLRAIPEVVYDNAFETWINDPSSNAGSPACLFYRIGMVPLEDHLNRLMRCKSPSWTDQPLVYIDDMNFLVGDWRWKYDVYRNKLLMCMNGPAEGNWTETLI